MTSNQPLYVVRDMVPGDKSFILSTFLKGLRFGNDLFKEIQSEAYFSNYQKIIEGLISMPSAEVKVACLSEDPDVILGYSIHSKDGTKVHWTFVKNSWRNIGICAALVPKNIKSVSHLTKTGLSLIRKKGINFNPFDLV